MRPLMGFRLEGEETLCDILRDNRHLGIHLMIHRELPGGIHTFEERPEAFLNLPPAAITPLEISRWDASARSQHSKKSFYVMGGAVDPALDVYPFPPVMTFTVGEAVVTLRVVWDYRNGGGDCLHIYKDGRFIASSGSKMTQWVLRKAGFKTYTDDVPLAKAVMTVIKFLDEKLYDEERAA